MHLLLRFDMAVIGVFPYVSSGHKFLQKLPLRNFIQYEINSIIIFFYIWVLCSHIATTFGLIFRLLQATNKVVDI